jgi:hypothetical protein
MLLGVIVIVAASVYLTYIVTEVIAEASGYQQGYLTGRSDGFTSGELQGYEDGYRAGEQYGYRDGYDGGNDDGYERGVSDGIGHGYTIKDPTYQQVLDFLETDKTNENEYHAPDYVCAHYARDVGNNAEVSSLRCAYVVLRHPNSAHTIVAFETVDEGMVYFDPQSDDPVVPVIGKRFYECIIAGKGYFYPEPDYDDTIEEILIIW